MKSKIIIGLAALLALSGCLADEYYNDPISNSATLTPGILVPLMNADINVENLLTKSTNIIRYRPNGEVVVYQEADSVKRFGMNDLYTIPDQKIELPVPFALISANSYSINDQIPLSSSNGTLTEITANIKFNIKSTGFPYPMELRITLRDISIPGQKPVVIVRDLPTGSGNPVIDLSNASIIISNSKFPIEITLTKKNSNSNSNALGSLSITTSIGGLTHVKGSLKETSISIPEGTYGINMGVFPQYGGTIMFNDPSLKFTYTNSTPFGIELAPRLTGRNDKTANTVLLTTNKFDINKRISNSLPTIDTISYDMTNCNIIDFMSISPNTLGYGGKLTINPLSQVTDIAEMNSSDGIYLGYQIELPLDLTVDGFNYSDTIDFSKSDLINKLEKARINITSQNGFPFETRSILSFCDSNLVVLDTLNLQLIDAAPVNAQGYVVSDLIMQHNEVKELNGIRLDHFKQTTKLILSTVLYTTSSKKKQMVVIQKSNRLKIQLGLGAQINTAF